MAEKPSTSWLWVFTGLLGVLFGVLLVVLLTPWSGGEVREKIHLGHESPERKIRRIRRKLDRLERALEA